MTRGLKLQFTIKRHRAAGIAVSVAPLLYFLPALMNGRVLCPADGLLQNVPFRVAAAQMIRAGHLPLWNPYIFSGMPLFAAAQVGILYPLNWFYLTFSPATATNLMVIATYVVAAAGAYIYARQVGSSICGAAITSIAWQFGGALIGQISHINIVQTAALLPWVLWSIDWYVDKGSIKRGAMISVIIALQFFAGHQQVFVNSFLLALAYAIVMTVANADRRKRCLTSFVFMGSGLLLAAIQILPTLELLRHSERAAATYEFFKSFSMPKRFVLAFVAPYVLGGGDGRIFRAPYVGPPFYAEMVGYVGLLTIMLAIISVAIKADVRTKFWAAAGAIGLLLAFGGYAPFGFYRLLYYLPVLNLFRVPARHLIEVDFALAVLAGRGFTVLAAERTLLRARIIAITTAISIFSLTIVAVTILRPGEFHLARQIPVTLLRAPELFVPIVMAAVSAYALWLFVRGKRGATVMVLAVLVFDLAVWGQSSGWFVESPHSSDSYFSQPETIGALNEIAPPDKASFRILTAPHQFDPAVAPVPPSVSHSTDWVLWTQPDIYMTHGFQNAAGYDGFGLARYSRLAGRMKVWGELTDPDTTLRGDSREIDLANVRYLLSMRKQSGADTSARAFANAEQKFSDYLFAANDLPISRISRDKQLNFSVPPVEVDRVALITNLAWSENVPDNTPVATLRLHFADGRTSDFDLKAGKDTSEWAYDRADIRARIRHRRAAVAASYQVMDAQGSYDAHTYVTAVALPAPAKITGGEILPKSDSKWPDLTLSVFRISLVNAADNTTNALSEAMFSINQASDTGTSSNRWKLATQTQYVDVWENATAMPRVWLASQTVALNEPATLNVIRSGRFADGSEWNPATTALVESPLINLAQSSAGGDAAITRYEPGRIDIRTKSNAPSVLVLSENHYPGWRAYVDGRFAETLRVDYNLRGVQLGSGEHRVEFIYRPKSVIIGFAISALVLLILAFASTQTVEARINRFRANKK